MKLDARARRFFTELQQEICRAVETSDGLARFSEEPWEHDLGHGSGGGLTRVIADGACVGS
jgi:coproporphyrinogen III oxidase